ncbi:hypothetical protein [Corynebacterium aquilae]|nr:hypothetical protein [Corynebacterium aquilae]
MSPPPSAFHPDDADQFGHKMLLDYLEHLSENSADSFRDAAFVPLIARQLREAIESTTSPDRPLPASVSALIQTLLNHLIESAQATAVFSGEATAHWEALTRVTMPPLTQLPSPHEPPRPTAVAPSLPRREEAHKRRLFAGMLRESHAPKTADAFDSIATWHSTHDRPLPFAVADTLMAVLLHGVEKTTIALERFAREPEDAQLKDTAQRLLDPTGQVVTFDEDGLPAGMVDYEPSISARFSSVLQPGEDHATSPYASSHTQDAYRSLLALHPVFVKLEQRQKELLDRVMFAAARNGDRDTQARVLFRHRTTEETFADRIILDLIRTYTNDDGELPAAALFDHTMTYFFSLERSQRRVAHYLGLDIEQYEFPIQLPESQHLEG